MNILEAMARKLKAIRDTPALIRDALEDTISDHLPEVADAVVEQLMEGRDAKGELMDSDRQRYKNPIYAELKQQRNSMPPPGVPDLKLSGDFHESIKAVKTGVGKYKITASDHKAQKLINKYGTILGLSPESYKRLFEDVWRPYFVDKAKKDILDSLKR